MERSEEILVGEGGCFHVNASCAWTHERMDAWTHGRMDAWTHGRIDACSVTLLRCLCEAHCWYDTSINIHSPPRPICLSHLFI